MHFQKHILKTVYTILILFELEKYNKFCFSNAKTNFDVFPVRKTPSGEKADIIDGIRLN